MGWSSIYLHERYLALIPRVFLFSHNPAYVGLADMSPTKLDMMDKVRVAVR